MIPQAVSSHYARQRRLLVATLGLVTREWSQMGDDFDASWARIGPRIAQLTAAAQAGAARNGATYVPVTLAELGQAAKADGAVGLAAFSGVAQSLDGLTYGSLDDLLYGAVIHAKSTSADSTTERLAAGAKQLQLLVHTQVSDAAKQAASVAMKSRPGVGYVRMVSPPCCQRCAVLAGKPSKADAFDRHPRCDCVAIPTTVMNPSEPLGSAIEPGQIKDLTAAQRQAIADGADMNQVINAHRAGMRSKNGMTTSEGATRRGIAGKRLGAERGKRAARLTPEGIYKVSATREEALQRLRDHGYLL